MLRHNDIKSVAIHGKITPPQRVKILEDFKKGGRDDARVLLISNVGSVGLNIAFANILIIVVSARTYDYNYYLVDVSAPKDVLWSVLNDQQLIGRVWRPPQHKRVHVYRLIGGNSADVLLNNLSFSKGLIQETFMNIGNSMRLWLCMFAYQWDN